MVFPLDGFDGYDDDIRAYGLRNGPNQEWDMVIAMQKFCGWIITEAEVWKC